MNAGEPIEDIEARCAALRQYATVLGDFWQACIDSRLPPDVAGDCVNRWWESVLAPVPERFDDD